MNPKVFFHKLTHNQFSEDTLGNVLITLNHLIPQSFKLLKINVDRYRMVPSINRVLPNSSDPAIVYGAVCEIFPTFPFIVASQLKAQPKYAAFAQQFQIAALGSTLAHFHDHAAHIDHFLEKIDTKIDLVHPTSQAGLAQDYSYAPRLVKGDLILIAKGLQWQRSMEPLERMETLYCMKGISQAMLRYYFDLLAGAKDDEVAQYIDDIFINFFVNLRHQEMQYWQKYPEGKKVKARLEHTIAKNSPVSSHPVLKKSVFDQIEAFFPIAHDGKPRQMSLKMKSLLDTQLNALRDFSQLKMNLLFRVLVTTRGPRYSRYLLSEVTKINPKIRLEEVLQSVSEGDTSSPASVSPSETKAPLNVSAQSANPNNPLSKAKEPLNESVPSEAPANPLSEQKKARNEEMQALLMQEQQAAEERDRIYQSAMKIKLEIDDEPEHVITVEQFLKQPISLNEKMKFLHSYTPETLTVKMHRVIQEVQNVSSTSSSNPISIYKNGTLLQKALLRILFPKNRFHELLQQKIIPILPEKDTPRITVSDFFSFPLAERKGPSEDARFEQHLYYLQIAKDQGMLEESDYEVLVENLDNFPILEYKKYYNIVRRKKFEDTTFMAVYSLWQNNGLQRMRLS